MVVFMLFCYDLILYTADLAVLTRFMDTAYGDSKNKKPGRWIMLLSAALFSCVIIWLSPFGGTYPFLSVLLSFFLLSRYPPNMQKKIFFSCIQCAVSFYLVFLILAILRSFEVNLRHIGINYFIVLGCMHASFWILIYLLTKFCSKGRAHTLPNHLLLTVLSIPCVSFIVLVFFTIRTNNNPQTLFTLEIPLLCAFIFMNIMAAVIYDQFCDTLAKNSEMILLRQQLDLSEQHFTELMEQQDMVKGIRHDMKNHFQTVLLMLKEKAPTNNVEAYIQNLISDISTASRVVSTGNMGIDAILSLKLARIAEKHIPLDSKITIPPGLKLNDQDSVIILGNILDNAIDACGQIAPEKRWIRLELTYVSHTIFIRSSNPIPSAPNSSAGKRVKGDAADNGLHGFGLKNVRSAIKKYDGIMDIDDSDQKFTVKIACPDTNVVSDS